MEKHARSSRVWIIMYMSVQLGDFQSNFPTYASGLGSHWVGAGWNMTSVASETRWTPVNKSPLNCGAGCGLRTLLTTAFAATIRVEQDRYIYPRSMKYPTNTETYRYVWSSTKMREWRHRTHELTTAPNWLPRQSDELRQTRSLVLVLAEVHGADGSHHWNWDNVGDPDRESNSNRALIMLFVQREIF